MPDDWFASARKFFVRAFVAIMIILMIVGVALLKYGLDIQDNLIASIGSSVFSAATVSVFFRLIAYDLYLRLLIENLFASKGYLTMLDNNALTGLLKDAIIILKKGSPPKYLYDAFNEYLLEELVGITTQSRSYDIVLTQDNRYPNCVLKVSQTYRCIAENSSMEDKPLFKDDKISKGKTDVPKGIPPNQIPTDPTEIFRYVELKIDNSRIQPSERVEYTNGTLRKAVSHECSYKLTVGSQKSVTIAHTTEFLIDCHDHILRQIITCANEVTVNICHPSNIEVDVVWFTTATPPLLQKTEPIKTSISYYQKVTGAIFPGNGFVVIVRPKVT